jgi:hypothetical protein
MKSKTQIMYAMKTTDKPERANCLAWVLQGEGWHNIDGQSGFWPKNGETVLAWDDQSQEYLIATFSYESGGPPQWHVCDKDRRTNITKWTYLE